MVGVPRSKGCQTCISRRTKCDEARPACGNCIKYGSCCPGYDRGFKFVAIKHNVRRPRGRRQPQQQSHSSPAVYVRRPHPSSGAASQGSRQTTGVDDGGDHQQRHVPGPHAVTALEKIQSAVARKQTVPPAPRHNTAQYVGTLLETLQRVSPQDESFATGTWIGGAAGRLSDARVLETAVYGFTQHLLGKLNRDDQAIAHARTLYGSSLKLLQQSLNHPEKWKMPETLGASLTLCFYELFAGTTNPDSWMLHAQGVSRLIQLRGPKAHVQEWTRSMLLSFRPIIIMNALFSGQDCFLAKEPWQAVIVHDRNIPTRTSAGEIMNPGNLEVGDRYFQLLAMVPGILRQGYALREANNRGEPIDIAQAVLLAETAQRVHAGFLEWHPRLLTIAPTPREILSEDSASIFPLVLKHDSVWMGALHMGYWASMLILQETLVQCRFPVDYADCNKEFALNILRSVETVGQGLMGGYRCGYSIRIAFEFVDDKQKAWLGMWLGRFEKNYAATSTKTYPSMET